MIATEPVPAAPAPVVGRWRVSLGLSEAAGTAYVAQEDVNAGSEAEALRAALKRRRVQSPRITARVLGIARLK